MSRGGKQTPLCLGFESRLQKADREVMEASGETFPPWVSLLYNFVDFHCLFNFGSSYFCPTHFYGVLQPKLPQ